MVKFYDGLAGGLIPYVRMLAWLNAVPDAPPGNTNLANRSKRDTRSRGEIKRDAGEWVAMPPVALGAYLVDYLMEVGPVEPAGMASAPISHRELHYWQKNIGVTLEPWELRVIRRLSGEYLRESMRATAPDCPVPWSNLPSDEQRDKVALQLRHAFGAMMGKDNDEPTPAAPV